MYRLRFLADRVLPSYTAITGIAIMGNGSANDEIIVWFARGFVTLCIAIIAWFIKRMVDDYTERERLRDKKLEKLIDGHEALIKLTAAHEVMYEFWIENFSFEKEHLPDGGGTRKTDDLKRLIDRIIESRKVEKV